MKFPLVALFLLLLVVILSLFSLKVIASSEKNTLLSQISVLETEKELLAAPKSFYCPPQVKISTISTTSTTTGVKKNENKDEDEDDDGESGKNTDMKSLPSNSICTLILSTDKSAHLIIVEPKRKKFLLWKRKFSSPIRATPVILFQKKTENDKNDNSRVTHSNMIAFSAIFSQQDGTVVSILLATGDVIFERKIASSFGFSPLAFSLNSKNDEIDQEDDISNMIVALPFRDTDITFINAKSGRSLGSVLNSDGVWSQPTLSHNKQRLYYALTASTKVEKVDVKKLLDSDSNSKQLLKSSWSFDILPGATSYKQKISRWIWTSTCEICLPTREEIVEEELKQNSNQKQDSYHHSASFSEKARCLVIFGSMDGKLRAVSAGNGKFFWTFHSGSTVSQPVLDPQDGGESFIVVTDAGVLQRVKLLNPSPQTILWNVHLKSRISAPLFLASAFGDSLSYVIAATTSSNLFVIDISNGKIISELRLRASSRESSSHLLCHSTSLSGFKVKSEKTNQNNNNNNNNDISFIINIGCKNGAAISVRFYSPLSISSQQQGNHHHENYVEKHHEKKLREQKEAHQNLRENLRKEKKNKNLVSETDSVTVAVNQSKSFTFIIFAGCVLLVIVLLRRFVRTSVR